MCWISFMFHYRFFQRFMMWADRGKANNKANFRNMVEYFESRRRDGRPAETSGKYSAKFLKLVSLNRLFAASRYNFKRERLADGECGVTAATPGGLQDIDGNLHFEKGLFGEEGT